MQFSQLLRYSGLAILLGVLAVGPFFQGLFFWTELLAAIALVSAGFSLWLIGRRLGGLPTGVPGGLAGGALLALLGCYILQFAWAVFPRGNIDWVLRVAAAWFAYVMVRAESGPGLRRWLGWVFVISAAAVGLVGLLEFTGYLLKNPELGEALSLVGLNERMYTTMQYPNTAAMHLLAAIFAAAGLALEDRKPWKLGIVGAVISLVALSFFFTVSRGAVVVLPFGLLLFFVGLDRDKRWPALLLLVAGAMPVVVTLKGVGVNAAVQNYSSAFRWIAAATVGGAVGGVTLAYLLRLTKRLQGAIAGGALALTLVGLLVLRPSGLLPSQATRLLDVNLGTPHVLLRLIYSQDAARIVIDHPFGRGGWGWDRNYRQYQQFNYTAQETHNHFAQTAVEAGAPGLLAILTALGAGLAAAWNNRKGEAMGWSLASGSALVIIHSLIDFDLSFGAVWFLLWSLLAATSAPTERRHGECARWWGTLGAGLGAVAMATILFMGSWYGDHAERLAAEQRGSEAVAFAKKAVRYDPWDSKPLLLIGDQAALERATQVDPNLAVAHWDLALLLERNQDLEGALREAKAALVNWPMTSMFYTKLASLTGLQMIEAVREGNRDQAQRRAAELLELEAEFERRKAVGDPLQHLWKRMPKLEMADEFRLRYGQALYLAGDLASAEAHLKEAGKVGLLGSEAHVWLYALYEHQGNTQALGQLEGAPWIRFRHLNPAYQTLQNW